ncbi:cell division protein PerM [Arthrobacter sp. A5]|uniref:cell division protein PerM n=1 Tax=Arthrobacter sp. A5 TaxID=576926 RepID=UPI003DA92F03
MRLTTGRGSQQGIPMPLWLQGAFESAQAAVISALLVLLPLAGVWWADGFQNKSFAGLARLGGQIWLVMHAVPLNLTFNNGPSSASVQNGTLSLVPLGLAVIPFLLSWRAGRRLARASYTDQLWQAVLGALLAYAAAGMGTAFICETAEVRASLPLGTLIPLIPVGLGLIIGARREAGTWGRLIGVDAADWIAATSQHSRWAGSYAWAAVRAGFVALLGALALSALLLVVDIVWHWSDIVAVYEGLKTGVVGGIALTIIQLSFLPNLVIWTLAWASGAGFALGVGSSVSPLGTVVAPVPAIPVLGALPVGEFSWGVVAMVINVLAGALAGWWFLRAGENHFDEWLAIKVKTRWFTATVSTLALGAVIGASAGIFAGVLALLAHGSSGLGRLTDIGPDFATTAVWVAVEVAVGVVVGYAAGPWLEREPKDAAHVSGGESG